MRQKIVQITLAFVLPVILAGLTVFVSANTAIAQVKTSPGATFCTRQGNFFWCHETMFTYGGSKQPIRYERHCRYLVDKHGRKGVRTGCSNWWSGQQRR